MEVQITRPLDILLSRQEREMPHLWEIEARLRDIFYQNIDATWNERLLAGQLSEQNIELFDSLSPEWQWIASQCQWNNNSISSLIIPEWEKEPFVNLPPQHEESRLLVYNLQSLENNLWHRVVRDYLVFPDEESFTRCRDRYYDSQARVARAISQMSVKFGHILKLPNWAPANWNMLVPWQWLVPIELSWLVLDTKLPIEMNDKMISIHLSVMIEMAILCALFEIDDFWELIISSINAYKDRIQWHWCYEWNLEMTQWNLNYAHFCILARKAANLDELLRLIDEKLEWRMIYKITQHSEYIEVYLRNKYPWSLNQAKIDLCLISAWWDADWEIEKNLFNMLYSIDVLVINNKWLAWSVYDLRDITRRWEYKRFTDHLNHFEERFREYDQFEQDVLAATWPLIDLERQRLTESMMSQDWYSPERDGTESFVLNDQVQFQIIRKAIRNIDPEESFGKYATDAVMRRVQRIIDKKERKDYCSKGKS